MKVIPEYIAYPDELTGYFPIYCQKLRTSRGNPGRGCMLRKPLLSKNLAIAKQTGGSSVLDISRNINTKLTGHFTLFAPRRGQCPPLASPRGGGHFQTKGGILNFFK